MTRSSDPDNTESEKASLDPLRDEALAWLVRLHSGEETERDWQDYHDWKTANDENARGAERAERLWEKVGPALKPKPRGIVKPIAVALVLIAGAAGIAFGSGIFGPPQAYFADQRTSVGERRTVLLQDGTAVELDSGTSFDVDFTSAERRIVLYTGQIYVTVHPDPARPLAVVSSGGEARALGTAFDVQTLGDKVNVVVTEHAVRVSYPSATANGPAVDVQAGQQVAYTRHGLGQVEQSDIRSATAWRRGQMIFDGRDLGDVVGELGRYKRGRIMITDSALNDLPVTGIFSSGDADALLDALSETLPVRVRRLPWLTLIQRDPDRPIEPFQRKN